MRKLILTLAPIFAIAVTTISLYGQTIIIGYQGGLVIWRYDVSDGTYTHYQSSGKVTSVTLGDPPDSVGVGLYKDTTHNSPAILTYNYSNGISAVQLQVE